MYRSFRALVSLPCILFVMAPNALADTPPSVPSSTNLYYQTLKEFTFDAGGLPDPQGWTTHDLTAQHGTFWHVDDFAGIFAPNLYWPIEGSKSMWCGVRQGTLADPRIKNAPGYGNGWTQVLQSGVVYVTPDDYAVYLSATLRIDVASWDHVDVEYRVDSGPWQLIERLGPMHPPTAIPYLWEAFVVTVPSTIQFRFVLVSDFHQSDENGANTNGAVILDNPRVRNVEGVDLLPAENFEAAEVGSTGTIYWFASVPAPFGNHAGLVSGTSVVQAGTPNTTNMWSFFNGSTETYACGGYPSQPALPKTAHPGSSRPTDYLCNEARSPWIDLSTDQNGQPVDLAMTSVGFEFDVYSDLPSTGRVRYTYRYRFMVGGIIQAWEMTDYWGYSDDPRWVHEDIGSLGSVPIPAGATHVQLGLIAQDVAYTDGSFACHSQSPLFDNVAVHRLYNPIVVTNTNVDGPGSLWQAIFDANAGADFNCILFNIPGSGPHTIPAPELGISSVIWIDGFSQPGSVANQSTLANSTAQLKIFLDGSAEGAEANGLHFFPGSQGVVRGIAIGNYDGAGIRDEGGGMTISGCYIGTNANGSAAVPNGVGIDSPAPLEMSGLFPEERMIISGNTGDAIRVYTGGDIANCVIGLDASGYELANGGNGIHAFGGPCFIGQPAPACPGVYPGRVWLAANASGILVEPAAMEVEIYQPYLDGNAIDLGGDGPTPNDPLDADTGANGLMNYPVLSFADGTTITGSMDGLPNELHRIEFFSGTSSSAGSATSYLGYQLVTTDGNGHAPIYFSCGPIPPASVITATANADGNTSELASQIVSMNTPPYAPLVNLYDAQNQLRATVRFDNVAGAGNTFLNPVTPPVPSGWNVGGTPLYWDISTTAPHTGPVEVCLHYEPGQVPGPENMLRLLHYEFGTWVDITTTVDLDGHRICGTTNWLSPFVIAVPNGATGVDDPSMPDDFALHANIPNPFNPVTTIHYDVPRGGADVTIRVFDVSGALVRTLVSEHRTPGRYTVQWNGEDSRGGRAASGVYFYRMTAGSFVDTRKMVLLK